MQVHCGHWETETCEIPGPVITRCIREPGCWVWDECQCNCVYQPGEVRRVEEQCPPRTVTKKRWVTEIREKEVPCVRYGRETVVEKRCEKVCRMVPEQSVKTCCYKVCRIETEQRVKTCTSRVCKLVTEQCTKEVPFKVCTMVRETRTKQVPVTTTRPVHETRTIDVVRMVPKRVPYTVTRRVPMTV